MSRRAGNPYNVAMDLFEKERAERRRKVEPLPVRMRPRTLDEFVGQGHFLGEGKLLRRMIQADRLTSLIFYGPPGCGKTTLARIIANETVAAFHQVNAAAVGVKEIREILDTARGNLETAGRRTVLFIDELHRFSRAQQDVLLEDVESGVVLLIGATTQNPFFAINSPLLSRSQIFQFQPLVEDDVKSLLARALTDAERGLGKYEVELAPEARDFLATICDGDARRALAALEVAVLSQVGRISRGERIVVDLAVAEESIQRKAMDYDATGDQHYDAASAFIKSMRGSDPDAAIYWMARMLESGEDPRFVARRVVICAAEDVGNADPFALVLANAAVQATEFVGLPECQLILAQAVTYIACSPKSNASAMAIWTAAEDVKKQRTIPVPIHLRDANYKGAEQFGHQKDYKYAHDYEGGYVVQDYLGVDKAYYQPTDRGREARFREYLARLRAFREQAMDKGQGPAKSSD
ncbi:MAG: putative AAA domain-containing protein [Phycisphaerae bacterium]|nr:putative AAA domain-containing protein [Phycisphaerae bacterium]